MAKRKRVPRPRNGGKWTEARFRSFVVSALRRASWPPKYAVLNRAFVGRQVNPETGRMCKMYKCEECGSLSNAKGMRADHIEPVVDPVDGFIDWNTFIKRLYVEIDGLQVLCTECHDKKTEREREIRKQSR